MQATTQTTPQRRGFEYRWVMALVLIIGVFMSILDTTIVNIAIPRLQSAFGTELRSA
jgi:fucose permease